MSPAPISDELLHAFVDGVATQAERVQVQRYLDAHPAEAARVEAYVRQRESLKAAFADVLSEPVPARVGTSRLRAVPWRALRVAAVLAWITLGCVFGWLLRGYLDASSPAQSAETELVRRARIAHVIYSAETRRAVEVAASQEEDMIRWLSKRMNTAVRVPNLSQFGFEALGGRLLPGSAGPACQLMYQNAAGKRLTIYLAGDPSGAAKPLRFSDNDKVHVVFWSDGTLAFAVSSELGNEDLQRIAAAVAQTPRL